MNSPADFAAPLGTPLSVVIAGGGKITAAHLADLMDDWIRFGTPDQAEVRVWLPGDKKYLSNAVSAAADWAQMDGRPGNSVVVTVEQAYQQIVFPQGEGQFTISAEESGADVAGTLIMALEEDNRDEQRTPYLIVAWGETFDPPDVFTGQLLTAATTAGIPILEISARGLQPWAGPEDEDNDPTVSNSETVAEPDEKPTPKESFGVADEAQAIAVGEEPAQPFGLMSTLKKCEILAQSSIKRYEALFDAPCESSLLQAILYWQSRLRDEGLDAVVAAATENASLRVTVVTPPAETKPVARKGRSRTADGQVSVFLSKEGVKAVEKGFQPGLDEVVIAKGRPRAGWVRRSVERDLVPASLL
jgi:hypothetical protein